MVMRALALMLILAGGAGAGEPLKARKHAALSFPDGKRITVDVVDTPDEREKGLMFRTKLAKDYGMLFVFPAESQMTFWMKNTLVPLDIVFIGADKKITIAHEKVKSSTVDTPDDDVARVSGVSQFVLELPSGASKRHHLKEGQELKFKAEIPNL